MSYVILVNQDDTLYGSKKSRIMQRQKLVNELVFIVDPIYRNVHDMTNASVMLEYVLPVSREYKTVLLTLSEERYNDCFLQYKLPFDTDITSQAGSLELQLTFAYTDLDSNGIGIQRVRKTSSTTIEIIPITAWSDIVPDSALSALDQRLIKLDASMRAINNYMDVLVENQVDDIVYDDKSETLKLVAGTKTIGHEVSVRDFVDDGIPVIDLNNSDSNNNNDNDNITPDSGNCDCGCDCNDNVVEIGYSNSNVSIDKNKEDNVVEF